jgi:thiamine-phosphate diphosphorylase
MIAQLVTDRRRLSATGDPECVLRQIAFAVEAGIDLVHIRERDLEAAELSVLVRCAVDLARGSRTRIVVNDRPDVAIACGAAGAHLRGDSVPPASVRQIGPAGMFILGASVHSVDEAERAAPYVDYLVAGTVWPTASKDAAHVLLGRASLAEIVRAVRVPVLGIGGVTIERLPELAACGCAGAAAIGLFIEEAQKDGCRVGPLIHTVAQARAVFRGTGHLS